MKKWNPYPKTQPTYCDDYIVTVKRSDGTRFVHVVGYYPEFPEENRFERPWSDGEVVAWMPRLSLAEAVDALCGGVYRGEENVS